MSAEIAPNSEPADHYQGALLARLDSEVRNKQELLAIESNIKLRQPVLYRIMADAAAELAPGDPKAHATIIGSFLMTVSEMQIKTLEPA